MNILNDLYIMFRLQGYLFRIFLTVQIDSVMVSMIPRIFILDIMVQMVMLKNCSKMGKMLDSELFCLIELKFGSKSFKQI